MQSQDRQPRQVDGGGEQIVVGVDLEAAPGTGDAAPVCAAGRMRHLAFDYRADRAVAGEPPGSLLACPGGRETGLVDPDLDGAPPGRRSALGAKRTGAAGAPEVGGPRAVGGAANRHGHLRGTGDGPPLQVDGEPLLAETVMRCGRSLSAAAGLDPVLLQQRLERARAVGRIAVDGRRPGARLRSRVVG